MDQIELHGNSIPLPTMEEDENIFVIGFAGLARGKNETWGIQRDRVETSILYYC